MLCDDCNGCCSRLCAPYGPTGVKVCQPAQGCRVNGDLCRQNEDCCGGGNSGLPGDGNVTCQKANASDEIGICRNPQSCNPEGNVCHFRNYAAEFLVFGNLGRNLAGQQFAIAQNRYGSFVTGSFERENRLHY